MTTENANATQSWATSLINADPANDADPSSTAGGAIDGDPFLGGGNQGTCQPGVGVATGEVDPTESWGTTAITDQASDYIGGSLTDADDTSTNSPAQALLAAQYDTPDFNDGLSYVVATAQRAPGASEGTVRNDTGETIEIGEWFWGPDVNA